MPIFCQPQTPPTLDQIHQRRHPATFWEVRSSSTSTENYQFLKELRETAETSTFQQLEQRFQNLADQLESLRAVDRQWDGFGAIAPEERSIRVAARLLKELKGVGAQPVAIRPAAEGGVGICFTSGNKYAQIEVSNDGDIYGLIVPTAGEPTFWEIGSAEQPIAQDWGRIRAALQP